MPLLRHEIVRLRPIVAETGPIGVGAPKPPPPIVPTSLFVIKHGNFIEQINTLDRCFARSDIAGFAPDELEDHIAIALQDNFIVEDGDSERFCTMQVAWRMKELLRGYEWERI